jgi:hypothetical protein
MDVPVWACLTFPASGHRVRGTDAGILAPRPESDWSPYLGSVLELVEHNDKTKGKGRLDDYSTLH